MVNRRGWRWVAVVLTVAALLGVPQLRIDFLPQSFYSFDAERTARLDAFKASFTDDESRLFLLAEGPLHEDALLELDRLRTDALALPGITGARTLLSLPHREGAPLDELRTLPLAEVFVGDDALAMHLTLGELDPPALDAAVADVEALARSCEVLTCGVTGHAVVRRHVVDTLVQEQARFVPLAALALCLVLGVLMRSARAVLVLFTPTALGALWTVGAMGWLGQELNVVNAVLPAILLVIGAADALHLAFGYQARRAAPDGLLRTFVDIGPACALTTATTMVGFGSLVVATLPILRAFALTAAGGVALLLLASLTTLPSLLPLLPVRQQRASPRVVRLAEACRARRAFVLPLALGVALAGLFGASKLTVDNRVLEYLPAHAPDQALSELWARELGGMAPFEVVWPDVVLGPDSLARVRAFQRELETVDFVNHTASVADVLALLGDETPSGWRRAAQVGLLQEVVSHDGRSWRVQVRGRDVGTRAWLAQEPQLEALITRHLGERAHLTGIAPGSYHGAQRLVEDLITSLGGALVLVVALIGLQLGSWRLALASVLPNVLPLLVAMGVLGFSGGTLQIPSAITFGVALGIAVDDTIHLLHAWRTHGTLASWAMPGRAVWVTTLVLCAGFSTLLLSDFPPNRTFGGLCTAMFLTALLADLTVLPALLPADAGEPA